MTKAYNLEEGSFQEQFHLSEAPIRLLGGGYGNGKTTAGVVDLLEVVKYYPGANILVARSTYPRLNDTVRKETLDWCPDSWVKKRPSDKDNTLVLKNGTHVNFRYIAQQGKQSSDGSTTSNLLSATYDFILVDQIEDPEISYKDFTDLIGRLRGATKKIDPNNDKPHWPTTGPRRMVITCNPTRNWVFRKLVKPLTMWLQGGVKSPDLLVHPKTGEVMIEMFEAPTYANKNLAPDYIEMLEATYKGQMADRYLHGKWAAYEGLVYPQYDMLTHSLPRADILEYFQTHVAGAFFTPEVLEGYDYGLGAPSCYIFSLVDMYGNVFLLDGFYEREAPLFTQSTKIGMIRRKYHNMAMPTQQIKADPAIFKRSSQGGKKVGRSVAAMFQEDHGVGMARASNDIISGITKVNSYIWVDPLHRHPITGNYGAPRLYHAQELEWLVDEISEYYWAKRPGMDEERIDKPMDRNDHAMDAMKYLMTHQPIPARPDRETLRQFAIPTTWSEVNDNRVPVKEHRYG